MFLTIGVVLMAGCSVEKRLYTSGYHVEWDRKSRVPEKGAFVSLKEKGKVQSSGEIASLEIDNIFETKWEPELVASVKKSGIQIRDVKMSYIFQEKDVEPFPATKSEIKKDTQPDPKKMNGFAIASLVSLILYIPLAIVFGAIALKQIKNNPEKYKGRILAKVCFILGIVLTAIGLLFSALLIIILFSEPRGPK